MNADREAEKPIAGVPQIAVIALGPQEAAERERRYERYRAALVARAAELAALPVQERAERAAELKRAVILEGK